MDVNLIPIGVNESFRFACSENVPCFNACCRDLNQLLTPYDIVRLKNHLGITSSDFLSRYCRRHTGPESGLPIVTLRPRADRTLSCPFVNAAGCDVYAHRPSSCRTYPLIRSLAKSRETGNVTEGFLLLKEPHCLGLNQKKTQKVRQWIEAQGLAVYYELNDLLMEIISLKNRLVPGPLEPKFGDIFYLALYDLDNFKDRMVANKHGNDMAVDPAVWENAQADDVELLKLGVQWVKRELFQAKSH